MTREQRTLYGVTDQDWTDALHRSREAIPGGRAKYHNARRDPHGRNGQLCTIQRVIKTRRVIVIRFDRDGSEFQAFAHNVHLGQSHPPALSPHSGAGFFHRAVRVSARPGFTERGAMNTELVRIGSHRARHKLRDLIGQRGHLRYFFSFHRPGLWAEIPAYRLAAARRITGITRAKPAPDIQQCLNWS